MKILHIIDEPYDSGIVQYALKAAAGLNQRKHLCSVWGLDGCFPVREAQRLAIPNFGYTHPWLNLPTLRRRLREESFDLIIAHTGSAHTLAVAAAVWHSDIRIPVIRTRGDARPMKPRPGRRLLWKRTAGFIAANNQILNDHTRLYGSLGVPADVIYEGSEDPGSVQLPSGGAPTIGIVGRLDPVKGHAYFLEAAARTHARFPDARFMVIGRSENLKSSELLERAHTLGIGDCVEFPGHVPKVLDYMRRCHIGVIASIGSEAVSRAAVEWMAAGRPLIATKVGCLPEYLDHEKSGLLVSPRSAEELSDALNRLISDSYLRETMGKASRKRFEETFTHDRFIGETERFYEKALHPVSS